MLDYVVVMADDFRAALAEFEVRLDRNLDQRFAGLRLDERFGELRLDERFAELRLDERFAELTKEIRIVYDGVVGVYERVGALELKFETFEERVEQRFDAIAKACRPAQTRRTSPRRRR